MSFEKYRNISHDSTTAIPFLHLFIHLRTDTRFLLFFFFIWKKTLILFLADILLSALTKVKETSNERTEPTNNFLDASFHLKQTILATKLLHYYRFARSLFLASTLPLLCCFVLVDDGTNRAGEKKSVCDFLSRVSFIEPRPSFYRVKWMKMSFMPWIKCIHSSFGGVAVFHANRRHDININTPSRLTTSVCRTLP